MSLGVCYFGCLISVGLYLMSLPCVFGSVTVSGACCGRSACSCSCSFLDELAAVDGASKLPTHDIHSAWQAGGAECAGGGKLCHQHARRVVQARRELQHWPVRLLAQEAQSLGLGAVGQYVVGLSFNGFHGSEVALAHSHQLPLAVTAGGIALIAVARIKETAFLRFILAFSFFFSDFFERFRKYIIITLLYHKIWYGVNAKLVKKR